VLEAREKESGCTVHLVDAGTDTGPVLLQRRLPVLPGDTPETLAERIHKEEHIAIVDGIKIMLGRIT
jgi:phosphoribosylglycinamide formyltransferase-1